MVDVRALRSMGLALGAATVVVGLIAAMNINAQIAEAGSTSLLVALSSQ